jgi:hypothetical protein
MMNTSDGTPAAESAAASAGAAEVRTTIRVTAGVAQMTVVGRLEPSTMPTVRAALDAVLRIRTPQIELDLSRAQIGPESVPLLTWMHRYVSHFGVSLMLSGVHHCALHLLKNDRLGAALPVRPANPHRQRAAARAEREERAPGLRLLGDGHPARVPSTERGARP